MWTQGSSYLLALFAHNNHLIFINSPHIQKMTYIVVTSICLWFNKRKEKEFELVKTSNVFWSKGLGQSHSFCIIKNWPKKKKKTKNKIKLRQNNSIIKYLIHYSSILRFCNSFLYPVFECLLFSALRGTCGLWPYPGLQNLISGLLLSFLLVYPSTITVQIFVSHFGHAAHCLHC